jgi:hypothetical protein
MIAAALTALVLLVAPALAQAQDDAENWLAVVQGRLTSATVDTLTINADRHAVVFTDRPERLAKLIPIRQLVSVAWGSPDIFAGDPPNASLIDSVTGDVAIIEMTGVTLVDDVLTVTFTLLEGTVPAADSNIALTIDAFPTAVNSQITDVVSP